MTDDEPHTDPALPDPPEGFRWQVQARHCFAIALPRRFHLLANTVDPLASTIRGRSGEDTHGAGMGEGRWPTGFWDAAVIGELDDGRVQPFRLLEFDTIRGREEPLTDYVTRRMWFAAREVFPNTLASGELPGYRLLDAHDATLGCLDALAFEYRWDGLYEYEGGGDHALVLWAPATWVAFHVYHHCPETEWTARKPELDAILATFTPLDVGADGEETWP